MNKNEHKRSKKPWPTKDAMEQVYQKKLWGDNNAKFYSGSGSHQPAIIKPYIAAISSFLNSFAAPISVCDLGCGDFNVGKELVPYVKKYVAVDIVTELINYNTETFKDPKLTFTCLDIAVDKLPTADCALVRQVLQHLSNIGIQSILTKLSAFKYVVITEHLPEGVFTPNKEIISGQGIRLRKQSGVNVLAAPFNFKIKAAKELVSIHLENGNGIIVTTLYTMF